MLSILRRLGLTRPPFYVGGVLGFAAGCGAMLIAFPFIFPPPVANEAPPSAAVITETADKRRIAFRFDEQAPGRDTFHWANGTGALIPTQQGWVLRFNEDFVAGPGPAYFIYLNTRPVADTATFRADAGRIKLLPIKSFKGGQNYVLPMEVDGKPLDPATFHTVSIWCEAFGVYIGSAVLRKP